MWPFRSGCFGKRSIFAAFLALGFVGYAALAAEPSPSPAKDAKKAKSAFAPGGVPLPIGHEAKGLVLPDYDTNGRLQARFEAATAKRIDEEHIQFLGMKMTTFTPENTPDLSIDMPASTLNLTTRVIDSKERTTVSRVDFNISGDTMQFDTIARQGRLIGNVKMVINDSSSFMGKTGE